MRHPVFTFLPALSLLLCVATVCIWVRSHVEFDEVQGCIRPLYYQMVSGDGTVYIQLATDIPESFPFRQDSGPFDQHDHTFWTAYCETHGQGDPRLDILGSEGFDGHLGFAYKSAEVEFFGYGESSSPMASPSVEVAAPLWAVSLLFLILPVTSALGLFRADRRCKRAVCASCGYDLRATPGRCPECGTVAFESRA